MKKSIVSILSAVSGAVVGACVMQKTAEKKISETRKFSEKHLALYQMMNQWVRLKQEGKNLAYFFEKNGYGKIAIYGMSYAGETLMRELNGTVVQVAYGIDKNAAQIYTDINIFTLEDDLLTVDAVVVTAITFFDELKEKLQKKMECPIISLEDILYEI